MDESATCRCQFCSVLSPSDTPERWTFEEKLRRYHALGVRELVTFHVDAPAGERLRIWDRLEHDLVLTLDEQRITELRARESAELARKSAELARESGDERIRELTPTDVTRQCGGRLVADAAARLR